MITLEFVIGLNTAICEDQGTQSILINENNLLSALSVQQWYDDIELCASALLRSIVIGHPFKDGNKRTAASVAITLEDFKCTQKEAEQCVLDIATGKLKDVEEIASILYSKKK